jgi:uncharacterized membrane protein YuzA (DUF378 family)
MCVLGALAVGLVQFFEILITEILGSCNLIASAVQLDDQFVELDLERQ